MGKNKRIDEAEKCITDQEIEIKELGQDIKRNRTVQALYKKIKDLQTQTELLLKNFSIEREQHQAEIMEKDMKIDKLVASWEKYNETRNKIKKKEEQVLLDTYCKGK
jgi:predicted RNase H-like nuclease (RuvC/YqgF family)|tara:strand:- start:58 stop:378 length:321 start_codon:yes stop_codon:yes gene_type:complete